MSQVQEYLDTFLRAVGKTPGLWSAFDVRCIAVQVEGRWHNLITRCRLDGRTVEDVSRLIHLPTTDVLTCRQMVLPIGELERFLGLVCGGKAEVAGDEIAFMDLESAVPTPYARGSVWVATRNTWQPDFERFPTAHRIALYGGGQDLFKRARTDRNDLDALVSTLERPWDGLDSLTQHALRTTTRIEYTAQGTVEVVAPLEARIEPCELRAGTLRYAVVAESRAVADQCRVGLFGVQPKGGVVSGSLRLSPKSWKAAGDGKGYRSAGSYDTDDALRLSFLLRVGPFLVDRQIASDSEHVGENPRVTAYAQFDGGLKLLTEVLQDPSRAKNEDEFHSVVARLFTLAGFSVDSFVADTRLSGRGIPDLLAYAPQIGTVLVVECTTGPLGSARDKLSLLVTRARRVAKALAIKSGDKALPVIVTSQADLPPHELDAARRSRVIVLTQRHLEDLFHLGQDQAPLQTVLSWCQAQIPAKGQSGPPQVS